MSEMYVLAASYDDVEAALADYQGIDAAHAHVGRTRAFDIAVVAKNADGKVEIVKRHDPQTEHATKMGVGWGLATGAVAALMPVVGIVGGLAVGGGVGAALGRAAGHAKGVFRKDDLEALGAVLERGDAGLVVLYGPDMADRVATSVTRATSKVDRTTNISPDQIAADMMAAEEAAKAPS